MLSKVHFSLSKITIYLLLTAMLCTAGYYQKYRKGVIEWDIISYYAYLPGLIIYNDLTFSFIDKNTPEGVVIWTERTPENKHVLKMTSGLSILYAAFFLMAHGIAKLQPHMYTPNGYSMVYSLFLILSDIFYTIVGLIYLRNFVPILLLFTLFTYVIFSWWCWWYGGGLSIRPMIDVYCIFAIGLAAFIHTILQAKSPVLKYTTL